MVDRFERFSYAIFEIYRCWHRLASEEMAKYDLKGPYAVYLTALDRCPEGITAAQLCDVCGRDKADVSRAMARMEETGLVQRCGDGNGYRAKLMLTSKGKFAADQVKGRAAVAVELAGRGFSDAERGVFYQVLETITENLQNLTKEGLPE